MNELYNELFPPELAKQVGEEVKVISAKAAARAHVITQ